jgi:hypothetical protein
MAYQDSLTKWGWRELYFKQKENQHVRANTR